MKKILFFSLALLATAHTFSMECTTSTEQQNLYKNLYTCQICPEQPCFGSKKTFQTHVEKSNLHYRMATKYMTSSCRQCGLRFASANEKLSHSAEAHPSSNTRKRKRTPRFDMRNAMELLNNGEDDTVTLYLTEEEIQQQQAQIKKQKVKKRNTKRRKKANILSAQPVQEISVTTNSSDEETESDEDFEMNGIALLLQLKRITRF